MTNEMEASMENIMDTGAIWEFPKIGGGGRGGTFFRVPIRRIIVYWGLYGGALILGNYHMWRGLKLGIAQIRKKGCFGSTYLSQEESSTHMHF